MANAAPPRRSGGGGGGGFLTTKLGPLPGWAWLLVGAGGIVLGIIILRGRNKNGTDNTTGTQTPAEIDPYTGVPYAVEESIDKATGIPFYYEYPGGQSPVASASEGTEDNDFSSITSGTPPFPGPHNPPPPPGPGPLPQSPAPPIPGQPGVPHPPGTPPAPGPKPPGAPPTPGPAPGPGPKPPGPPPPGPGPKAPGPAPVPPGHRPPPAAPVPQRPGHPPGPAPRRTITVRPWPQNDSSLWSIWQQNGHGIAWPAWERMVMEANPAIKNPNVLYPNEELTIP